jgi:hypothetical protein
MDHAAPGNKTIVDGWLNRYLTIAGGGEPIAGVSLSMRRRSHSRARRRGGTACA